MSRARSALAPEVAELKAALSHAQLGAVTDHRLQPVGGEPSRHKFLLGRW